MSYSISSVIDKYDSDTTGTQITCSKHMISNSRGVPTSVSHPIENDTISSSFANGDSVSEKLATKTIDSQLESHKLSSSQTEPTEKSISQMNDNSDNKTMGGANMATSHPSMTTSKAFTVSEYDNIEGMSSSFTFISFTTSNNIISIYNPSSDIVGNAMRYSPTSGLSFGVFIFILCLF
ncbi:unnamed protein product [[Candida] boidinii]|uniref:Unnamed protein product n=1 Tax=Candida boidinii TaxID=5477 RepID=A0ACB5U652_CANBO|nr:unnamed protein product [[Candida] boidinii]